jgi:hypothetical protein
MEAKAVAIAIVLLLLTFGEYNLVIYFHLFSFGSKSKLAFPMEI